MFSLPRRLHLIAALCLAGIFAIPMVTLVSSMVVFPILFYGLLAIAVNVGLLILPFAFALNWFGLCKIDQDLWHAWLLSAIVWTGCAFGFANWGYAGATIGAKDKPFLDVFFAPILMVLGYPIG